MNPDQRSTLGWLHALPLGVIVVLAVMLWRPAPDPPPSAEAEMKIADLAARLGSSSSSAADIDDRLRSFGPFPPDPKASRALAEALITCGTTRLDASRRSQLARDLFRLAVIGDDRAQTIPAALVGIERAVANAGPDCNPVVINRVLGAAHAVATTDPGARRDWW